MQISEAARKLYDFLQPVSWMTAENLAKGIHVRKGRIGELKKELEAAGLINIYYYPNGKRANPTHRIVKNTKARGNPICKHVSKAYCFDEWAWLDRNSLIECYLKSDLNIIPFNPREKRPVKNFNVWQWKRNSLEQKMDFFYDNPTLNVGLVVCHFTVVDSDTKSNRWLEHENFGNTLTVSTARGFQSYFRKDPVITTSVKVLPDIDTRCKGSYVVLPPSIHPTGIPYEWATIAKPELLPIEFRREWQKSYFDSYTVNGKFNLPNEIPLGTRNDTLWRYGRSLRCSGKNYFEIETILTDINQTNCAPPLDGIDMNRLIDNVWNRENRPTFQG